MQTPTIHRYRFTESGGRFSEFFVISGEVLLSLEDGVEEPPILARNKQQLCGVVLALRSRYPNLMFESRIPYVDDPALPCFKPPPYRDGCYNEYWVLKPEEIPEEIRDFVIFPNKN